jgi:hypothetical protein
MAMPDRCVLSTSELGIPDSPVAYHKQIRNPKSEIRNLGGQGDERPDYRVKCHFVRVYAMLKPFF